MANPIFATVPAAPAAERTVQLQFTDTSPEVLYGFASFRRDGRVYHLDPVDRTPGGNGNFVGFNLALSGSRLVVPGVAEPFEGPVFSFQCEGGMVFSPPNTAPSFAFSIRETTSHSDAKELAYKEYIRGQLAAGEAVIEYPDDKPPAVHWGVAFPLILRVDAADQATASPAGALGVPRGTSRRRGG